MVSFTQRIRLDFSNASADAAAACEKQARAARQMLEQRNGPGNAFLGWLDLPRKAEVQLSEIEAAAKAIRQMDALVVIGIGGSYLGASAAIAALRNRASNDFPVHFAGCNLDPAYHADLLALLHGKRYAVNVISKSGTTTEPALALRLFLADLGADAAALRERVFATTDREKGALRRFADRASLTCFTVPDDVGGRFSVLSPVGLLPLAAAGVDIRLLLEGAAQTMEFLRDPGRDTVEDNPAMAYAAHRFAAYRAGKKIEVMATYCQSLSLLAEWWKQLFGESEGKGGHGLFPASVNLTADLHSLGQWLQDGERIAIETILDVETAPSLLVPSIPGLDDGFEHVAGRELQTVNRAVQDAAASAHAAGGLPCLRIAVEKLDAASLGALLYFFEYACGISAYMLGVNPFDQPGVEAYKKGLKQRLGQ